jgi:hypothetical protein
MLGDCYAAAIVEHLSRDELKPLSNSNTKPTENGKEVKI